MQAAFTVIDLDGISFDTDTTDAGWEELLDTLPAAQQVAFKTGPSQFASPGYKIVDNMVYLRGVMQRMITNSEDPDVVPVIGFLPQTFRPPFNMNYPSVALNESKLHHITIDSAGQIRVDFDADQRYISLDGMAFARVSGGYTFTDWRFGTDDGDTLQLLNTPPSEDCPMSFTKDLMCTSL